MRRMAIPIVFFRPIVDYSIDKGILVSLSKNPKRTVENITSNVALVKSITGNKPVPSLFYLSDSLVPDKATHLLCNGHGFETRTFKIHYEY